MVAWSVFLPLSASRATTHSCPHSSLRKNSVRNIIKGQARHLFLNPLAHWNKVAMRTGLGKCVCVRKRQWEGCVCVYTVCICVFCFFLWSWEHDDLTPLPPTIYHTASAQPHNLKYKCVDKKKLHLISSHLQLYSRSAHNMLSFVPFLSSVFCYWHFVQLVLFLLCTPGHRKIPRYTVTLFRQPALSGIHYINIHTGQQHTKTDRHAHIWLYTQ